MAVFDKTVRLWRWPLNATLVTRWFPIGAKPKLRPPGRVDL
jgi:hypothetical protein